MEDRAISLNDVLDVMHEMWGDSGELLDAIKELPPVIPKPKWIPVSERLPEEDGCYLVTTTGTNNSIIDIAYYTEGIWHKASKIKAWMPLPTQYEPQESEDNECI